MLPAAPRVVLLGGTSEIGLAVLRALDLPEAARVVLVGRDRAALEALAGQWACPAELDVFDATALTEHEALLDRVFAAGPVDLLLPAFGVLGDQARAEGDPGHAVEVLTIDLVAQAGLLLGAARRMRAQGHGTLVVFSSVAAVRARRANFVYGAGKAGLDAFAGGLADSLSGSGVHVLLVRPGFVIGRMTAGMAAAPLAVRPDEVGREVAAALRRGADVVWVPRSLRLLAAAMRLVPRPLWRRLRR